MKFSFGELRTEEPKNLTMKVLDFTQSGTELSSYLCLCSNHTMSRTQVLLLPKSCDVSRSDLMPTLIVLFQTRASRGNKLNSILTLRTDTDVVSINKRSRNECFGENSEGCKLPSGVIDVSCVSEREGTKLKKTKNVFPQIKAPATTSVFLLF